MAPDPNLQGPGSGPIAFEGPVAAPSAAGAPSAPPTDIYWGWWHWYSRSELRDQKVALFADYLSRGSYLYSYTMRATLPTMMTQRYAHLAPDFLTAEVARMTFPAPATAGVSDLAEERRKRAAEGA